MPLLTRAALTALWHEFLRCCSALPVSRSVCSSRSTHFSAFVRQALIACGVPHPSSTRPPANPSRSFTLYTVHRTPETSPPLPLPSLASPGPIPPPSRPPSQPTPGRATVRGDRRGHLQEELTGPRARAGPRTRGVKTNPRVHRPQWTLTSTLPSTTKTVTAC
jgi:hypothetical protein